MKKAFCCWSGGKDSCLAFYRGLKQVNIDCFINMISEDGLQSRSHGVDANLLKQQTAAIGVKIIQPKSSWETYEEVFKNTIRELKLAGIDIGIFGDIDLQEHRDWVERVCKEIEIDPLFPLWKEDREKLITEFIDAGFRAIVVATNSFYLGEEWLGREINHDFVRDLKTLESVDLCGEKGEYHTFVYDGPIFKNKLRFGIGKKMLKDKNYFLEIIPK